MGRAQYAYVRPLFYSLTAISLSPRVFCSRLAHVLPWTSPAHLVSICHAEGHSAYANMFHVAQRARARRFLALGKDARRVLPISTACRTTYVLSIRLALVRTHAAMLEQRLEASTGRTRSKGLITVSRRDTQPEVVLMFNLSRGRGRGIRPMGGRSSANRRPLLGT